MPPSQTESTYYNANRLGQSCLPKPPVRWLRVSLGSAYTNKALRLVAALRLCALKS